MKCLAFLLFFCSLMSFEQMPSSSKDISDISKKPFKKVYVNTTLTSNQGCSVHIQGWVEFTLLPPKFIGFEGTVNISGPRGCPTGTLTFSRVAGGTADLLATPNVDDVCTLQTLSWTGGNSDFVNILNETAINASIVAELNAMCDE